MQNLPEDVLCKIRGFAMPIHPCTQEIKNRIRPDYINQPYMDTEYGTLAYHSEEHYWVDFDWEARLKGLLLLFDEGDGVNRTIFSRYYLTWYQDD